MDKNYILDFEGQVQSDKVIMSNLLLKTFFLDHSASFPDDVRAAHSLHDVDTTNMLASLSVGSFAPVSVSEIWDAVSNCNGFKAGGLN